MTSVYVDTKPVASKVVPLSEVFIERLGVVPTPTFFGVRLTATGNLNSCMWSLMVKQLKRNKTSSTDGYHCYTKPCSVLSRTRCDYEIIEEYFGSLEASANGNHLQSQQQALA